jgi:hypothetical protein
LEVRRSEK